MLTFLRKVAASVAAAPANKVTLFVDDADGLPKVKDEAGTVTSLKGADGATGPAGSPPAPSIQTLTSASTITPVATNDLVSVSALAVNATIANPTGTAAAGQGFVITIKDDGTARTLTWGSNYVGMDGAPVATTTAGKLVDIPVRYSAILSKWLVYKPSVQA